jgi:mRNA interferase MazF
MTFPRRGEIYLVEFDLARGHEIRKTRPPITIWNDIGNRHSSVTIVAAFTGNVSPLPVMVMVAPTRTNGLSVSSAIHLGQARSVDRQRLVKRLGSVDEATMGKAYISSIMANSTSSAGWKRSTCCLQENQAVLARFASTTIHLAHKPRRMEFSEELRFPGVDGPSEQAPLDFAD